GRIVERGSVQEVLTQPCHPYTLGLVRSAPDVDHPRSSLVAIPGAPPSLVSPPAGCRFHPRCKFAEEDCTATEPALRLIDAGHSTACLHFGRCRDELRTEGAARCPRSRGARTPLALPGPPCSPRRPTCRCCKQRTLRWTSRSARR